KFLGTIAELAIPWVLSHMIDNVIPRQDPRQIYLWGGVMLVCALIAVVFNIVANRMASMVSRNTTERIRYDLFSRVLYLSNAQMDGFTLPSLTTRLTTDTYNVHQMLGMMQRLGVRAPIMFLGGILITLTLDPALTLVMLAVMPLIILILVIVSKIGVPMYTTLQKKNDQYVRVVREDVSGIRIIKALSKENYEREKFQHYNREAAVQEKKAGMVMNALGPGVNLCLNGGMVLVILAGAIRVDRGLVQPGVLIAFLSYVTLILNAIIFLSRMLAVYSRASASAGRIAEVLDAFQDLEQMTQPEVEVLWPQNKKIWEQVQKRDAVIAVWEDREEKEIAEKTGDDVSTDYNIPYIEFEQVTFSYHKKESNVKNISFAIDRGQTLGILGATGSGKSTILQLLMRFYDVDEGAVRIDGRDVRTYSSEELHSLFGVVFQNDFIIRDSIAENINFGRGLEEAEIQMAAGHAQADAFIREKADSYETVVAVKGADLSGGQKQRLLISRALAAHPAILVLDDSMSALDYKTDAALRQQLQEHFDDTTAVIVAQRISSVLHADKILVLDEGRTAGYGTHEELMASCEIYQDLYRIQTGQEVKRHG
ncbi:MAG: ABC transporter ATP-binding protein, partial [Lachnospiraceae bacterium]|nr:ABC transporter ATP-binding protein [Lachnospiraceae bacterium]